MLRSTIFLLVTTGLATPVFTSAAEPQSGQNAAGSKASSQDPAPWSAKPSQLWRSGLPKWLELGGEFRTRGEGRKGFGFEDGADDAYALTRLRFRLKVTPSSRMHFLVEGQDSRVAAIDPQRKNRSVKNGPDDLRQAYLHFGHPEQDWIRLKAGRQELKYGDQRLIGSSNWGNTSRVYDAAKLSFGSSRAAMDIFAGSVVKVDPRAFDKIRDGENIYGAYGFLRRGIVPAAVVEPYLLYKTDPRIAAERGGIGGLDLYTAGFRATSRDSGADLRGFDYTVEAARQWGGVAGSDLAAWAGAWIVGYTLPDVPARPRLLAEFDYASGDQDRNDGKIERFDNLYPANHDKYGIADLVGWRNMKALRTGVQLQPRRRVKVDAEYHWFWLADRHDHFYSSSGSISVRTPVEGAAHTDIGQEIDIQASYALSPEVELGAGLAHLFPGRYLEENSPGSATTYPYVFATYKF